jgi:uncharacterized protein DUF1579
MSARPIAGLMAALALVAAPAARSNAQEKKADKPAAAMAAPKPPAEISNLAFFAGQWTCAGEGAMEPGGPMMKMTSTVSSNADLGGFWQSGSVKGTTVGMPPFHGMFHMTYDPGAKDYVMLWVDNMGGWSQTRSPGWQGDKIVFTGNSSMGGKTIPTRDTFTKGAGGSLVHLGEMQTGGAYTKTLEETCRKGANR